MLARESAFGGGTSYATRAWQAIRIDKSGDFGYSFAKWNRQVAFT